MATKTFGIKTADRAELFDITHLVSGFVKESGVMEGVATVFVPHTTAGVTINENADPDVARDILHFLNKLVPQSYPFRHAEGNSDAHIKASFMGFSVQIPISNGRLKLGTWQGIYFTEFDGPRSRNFVVTIIKAD